MSRDQCFRATESVPKSKEVSVALGISLGTTDEVHTTLAWGRDTIGRSDMDLKSGPGSIPVEDDCGYRQVMGRACCRAVCALFRDSTARHLAGLSAGIGSN